MKYETPTQFARQYSRLTPRLMSMGREFFGSELEAEEVVQETWLRAWSVHEDTPLTDAYILRIARNVCVSIWRGQRPTVELESIRAAGMPVMSITPQEEVEERENSEWLASRVARLPKSEQDVWKLFYDDGLTIEEIAKKRGISIRSARNIISTVRRKLRSDLRRRFVSVRALLIMLLTAVAAGVTVSAVVRHEQLLEGVNGFIDHVFNLPVDTLVYRNVDEMPTFGNNELDFYKFIATNVSYPESARADSVGGRVIVLFVVEMDGTLSNFSVHYSPDERLSAEALRVLKKMPPWHPARRKGKVVRCMYTVPIFFRP